MELSNDTERLSKAQINISHLFLFSRKSLHFLAFSTSEYFRMAFKKASRPMWLSA